MTRPAGSDAERYLRQILLPEIGAGGQARLAAARAAVAGDGLAQSVASRYAGAAGVGEVVPGPVDVAALAPPSICEHDAPRAVLAGARAALAAIRDGLGLPARAARSEGLPS